MVDAAIEGLGPSSPLFPNTSAAIGSDTYMYILKEIFDFLKTFLNSFSRNGSAESGEPKHHLLIHPWTSHPYKG
jgi:hypothetical protein